MLKSTTLGRFKFVFSLANLMCFALFFVLLAAETQGQGQGDIYKKVLSDCAGKQGLCAIIGVNNESAQLACDLARDGKILVHCVASDDKSLREARGIVSKQGLDGFVAIEQLPLGTLPYRNNLVNFMIVPDLGTAQKAGFSEAEAMRALATFGKLFIFDQGKLKVTDKKMDPRMDEWTHNMHGPDGNRMSKDTLVSFPVGYRWHSALPFNIDNKYRHGNRYTSTRGMAIVNGRCFTFSDSVIDNLKSAYFLGQELDQYVTARDAFNGMFLWRKKIGKIYYGGLWQMNMAPFAAVGDYVYTVSENGKLLMIDAATGDTFKTLDTKYAPCRLLVDDGVLVSTNWKDGTSIGESKRNRYERIRMHSTIEEGDIEAYDAKTGEKLWEKDGVATSICSADGAVYVIERDGPDLLEESKRLKPIKKKGEKEEKPEAPKVAERPVQAVVAFDLKTGKELWRIKSDTLVPDSYKEDHLRVDAAGEGLVSVIHTSGKKHRVSVLSGKDGKVFLQKVSTHLPIFVDNAMHFNRKKYDPATAKEIGKSQYQANKTICTPSYASKNILVRNRGGQFVINGKPTYYAGARGACAFGSTPAYGAFYTAQNWCLCMPSQISGFICFGPVKSVPTSEELCKAPEIVKGEAFNVTAPSASEDAAALKWSMARGNITRNSYTPATVPQKLELLWNTAIPTPKLDSPVAMNWREYLNGPLTGPVIADGIVACSVYDSNEVIGLSLDTGTILWKYSVGSRVDSSPTLYNGICLFGAHDGYVYALDAKTGKMKWKMRMAPNDERMVSYGKVESPWPVIGSVAISDGIAYASAGRSQGSDGGVIVRGFKPSTGEVLWSNVIPPPGTPKFRNDFIVQTNGALQLMFHRLDPKTGQFVPNRSFNWCKYQTKKTSVNRQLAKYKKLVETSPKVPYYVKALARYEKDQKNLKEPDWEPEIAFATGSAGKSSEGIASWNWLRLGNRKFRQISYGNIGGNFLCWDDKQIYTLKGDRFIACYSMDKVESARLRPKQKRDWGKSLPANYQITSLILCGNAVIASGGIYAPDSPEKGFVCLRSRDNGEKLAEHILPAPVVFDGAAVVNNRICVALKDSSIYLLGQK